MVDDLEHPMAVYFENGVQHQIFADDLQKADVYRKARESVLFVPSGEAKLMVRAKEGEVRPHFYLAQADKKLKRTAYSFEYDDAHNRRVDQLLNQLKPEENKTWQVGYKKSNQQFECLFRLENYNWSKETHRIMSSRGTIRHDLFGQSRQNAMSVLQPTVAIEVINTHWPEQNALEDMLAFSEITPSIVLFDTVDPHNTVLRIRPREREIQAIFYIQDGIIMKDGRACMTSDSPAEKEKKRSARSREDLRREVGSAVARFARARLPK
ncbi:MAG TPA: hypothetical protein VGH81_07540 [Rudaea sp.]